MAITLSVIAGVLFGMLYWWGLWKVIRRFDETHLFDKKAEIIMAVRLALLFLLIAYIGWKGGAMMVISFGVGVLLMRSVVFWFALKHAR